MDDDEDDDDDYNNNNSNVKPLKTEFLLLKHIN